MWKFYQAVRHSASSSNNRGINHFSHTLHTQISDKKDIEWRRESKRETLARCISRQAAHHMRSCTLTLCSHLYKRSFSLIASRSTLLRMRRGQARRARFLYLCWRREGASCSPGAQTVNLIVPRAAKSRLLTSLHVLFYVNIYFPLSLWVSIKLCCFHFKKYRNPNN